MDQSTYASAALQPGFDAGAPAAGPFVVNLCASVAPIDLKPGGMPGLERYRLYQVRRVEDNRPRYRLRLGFFASEAASEVVLAADGLEPAGPFENWHVSLPAAEREQ